MTKQFDEFVSVVMENHKRKTNMDFFYGLKTLLEKGDQFTFIENSQPELRGGNASCKFIYNGTRNIHVFWGMWWRNQPTLQDTTVSIFEHDEDGRLIMKETNVFYNEVAKFTEKLSFDPKITTVEQFVDYVRAVLDRQDRGDPDTDPKPEEPQSPPSTKVPQNKSQVIHGLAKQHNVPVKKIKVQKSF